MMADNSGSELLVHDFLSRKRFALYGMSRSGRKFGNKVFDNLSAKGYRLFPIHPEADTIGSVHCWPDLMALPERVDGVVIVVPPEQTEKVVREAAAAGVKRVWMQPGAESAEAIRYCQENGMSVVSQECIMMLS